MEQSIHQPLITSRSIVAHQLRITTQSITVTLPQRSILSSLHTDLQPHSLTAIMGPSGSGKTTFLNVLAGRIYSPKMEVTGKLFLNGLPIKQSSSYSKGLGYVMQEDILPPAMTPKEIFKFTAEMRLDRTFQQKQRIVQGLIRQLGLVSCQDVQVGQATKKGLSGGQRKRTSIGVQLVTNPNLIFLDQPMTGLDSSIAFQVILILKKLASDGRTVVLTLHQPSQAIFNKLDKLIFLAEGHILYQDKPQNAAIFFKRQSFQCPALMNIAEYLMGLFNREGVSQQEYEDRIKRFRSFYQEHKNTSLLQPSQQPCEPIIITSDQVSLLLQFWLVSKRSVLDEFRQPKRLRFKLIQNFFISLMAIAVFGKLGNDLASIRNRNGLIFFLLSNTIFNSIQGSLHIYIQQRKLYIKQRLSHTYSTSLYFWARSLSVLPIEVAYTIIAPSIVYFICGLHSSTTSFFIFLAVQALCFWACSGIGLLLSSAISDVDLSMVIVPLIVIPLMLLSGFFIQLKQISSIYLPLQYFNPYRYATQACFLNEYVDNGSIDPFINPVWPGNKQNFFPSTIWLNMVLLFGIGLVLRILSVIGMWYISTPSAIKFQN